VVESCYQIGLLFVTELLSAARASLRASETWHLLYFYGNGMSLETSSYEFARFRQLGFNVLIAEYPGYGMSSGQASESGCYEAANAAYHYLKAILHVHPAQIIVDGWSLGAAVAIDLASRKQLLHAPVSKLRKIQANCPGV
jgi:pimeloyl-ACP methyl ester carboxylesterase